MSYSNNIDRKSHVNDTLTVYFKGMRKKWWKKGYKFAVIGYKLLENWS